ncbi:MAG: SxtJ family membrane protein [Candidatus Omnitrophota bacterium]|nr:SxtJ family membrane protein [Candidatus Omnitrophota bacterium]
MEKQNTRDIKLFGSVFTVIFSLLAIKLFKSGKLLYKNFIGISALLLLLTLLSPQIISPLYRIFKFISNILGWLISNLMLILIYYLVFTLIGLFLRLIGKDLLDLEKSAEGSYWIKKPEVFLKDRYIKQF